MCFVFHGVKNRVKLPMIVSRARRKKVFWQKFRSFSYPTVFISRIPPCDIRRG